ncbi:hypothetical protein Tco_0750727 [Tanacetum coccineum]|uniref:Uncharacterized protein n=1 Tax=Tanacetum coccineum TaxID=301880 RepID=A0ABQ4Z355_9ASTR
MVAFFSPSLNPPQKSNRSAGFHQVIDFLARSHICYALTKKPVVSVSFIKQFWRSAEASTDDNGEVKIIATIDSHSMTITKASLRHHLKLDDQDGITSLPNSEIFKQLTLMRYHTESDNPKKTAWEQFSSNIATAVICQEVALFPTMLHVSEPSTSPSRISSSPSHSPEPSPSHSPEPSPSHSPAPSIEYSPDHTTAAASFPSPTQPRQPSPKAEYPIPTPNESPLYAVHSYGSAEGSLKLNELPILVTKLSERIGILEDDLKKTKLTYSAAITKLILRLKKLEAKVKAGTARKRARVVLTEDDEGVEDVEDESSKQGRKLSDAEKGNSEVSIAGATKGTVSEVPVVSTAKENISTVRITVTYRRRSEEKRTRKDKGKAIMTEPEPKKKSKKELEQERLSFAEAIRLQEQMDEEQRAHIARDEEIARQ